MCWRNVPVWLLGLTLLCGVAACGGEKEGNPPALSAPDSVTIFPVWITPGEQTPVEFRKALAELLGMWLERAGVRDVQLSQTEFVPPEGAEVAQVAEAFGKFILQKPIPTQYAMFGHGFGTPKTGAKAIETIVVDRQGKVVLADRDTPKTFARVSSMKLDCPMNCTIFLARKAQQLWGLPDPFRPGASGGKLCQQWCERTGVPSEKERAAMEKGLQAMKAVIKTSGLTIYAAHVGSKIDHPCAEALAAMLRQRGISQAVAPETGPELQIKGSYNEQKVLWDTARAFREYVQKNPPVTPYALYAQYGVGIGPDGKSHVDAVHFIVCDRSGDWVIVDFQNSHQADFQSIQPKSPEDCNRLVLKRLQSILAL